MDPFQSSTTAVEPDGSDGSRPDSQSRDVQMPSKVIISSSKEYFDKLKSLLKQEAAEKTEDVDAVTMLTSNRGFQIKDLELQQRNKAKRVS